MAVIKHYYKGTDRQRTKNYNAEITQSDNGSVDVYVYNRQDGSILFSKSYTGMRSAKCGMNAFEKRENITFTFIENTEG